MTGATPDLPEGVELTELDSGLRVVTEAVPSVRSVALGMWVRTGSRDEAPAQAGVSHFLEHLLFKGTERHSAIEISELFDGMGAADERGDRARRPPTCTPASSTSTPRRPST